MAFTKDQNSILDYTMDWSDWLPAGDTIASSLWVLPSGVTSYAESNTPTEATVWVSGGTVGHNYRCTNRITTALGRVDERSFTLTIQDR